MALKVDENPGQVYDPEDKKPNHNDGLEESWNADNSGYDENRPESKSEPSLSEQELSSKTDDGNKSLYVNGEQENNSIGLYSPASGSNKNSRNKKIAGGILVSIILSLFGAAMFLPSIMMQTITSKLSDAFLGRAKFAVEQRAELYVKKYVTEVIGTSLRECGTTISRNCSSINVGEGSKFSLLASNWRVNNIEDKLFRKQGIEFQLDQFDKTKIKVFKIDGLGNKTELGDFGKNTVAREVVKAIETETKFDGILTRRHIRSVLSKKYGAEKFCFIACDKKDEFDEARVRGVEKIKLKMIARVSEITSGRLTAYMLCVTVNCSREQLESNDNQIVEQIRKRTDKELVETLAKDIEKYGTKNLSELVVRKTIDKLITRVASEELADKSLSAIPVAGQIYLAATIAELIANLDDKVENKEVSKFLREVNMQESALFTTQILTMSEDTQSLQAPIGDQWAAFQYLNGFSESRVWQKINNSETMTSVECKDGVVLSGPNDPLACPELQIQPELSFEKFRNNQYVSAFLKVTNAYESCFGISILPGQPCPDQLTPRYWIRGSLNIINGTVGAVSGALVDGLTKLPGIGNVTDTFQEFVATYAEQLFGWLSETLLPNVINPDAEDQLAFDQAALGFDVLGNTFAKGSGNDAPQASGIDGVLLSAKEQAEIDKAISSKKYAENADKNIFSRYFDIQNTESLVSNSVIEFASLIPADGQAIKASFDISAPFKSLASSIDPAKKVSAEISVEDRANLFGVSQYGYSIDDPNLYIDPSTLTQERCDEFEEIRERSATINNETGEIEYYQSNPCSVDDVVIDSLTKVYDLDTENSTNNDAVTNSGASAQYIPNCDVNNGNAQIACEAIDTMLGVPYKNSYSNVPGCRAQPSASNDPNPSQLDCSAFTSMAVYRAFGTNAPRSSVAYLTSPLFEVIGDTRRGNQGNIRDIQPGDLVGRGFCASSGGAGCNGHIGIVVSYDKLTGNLVTAETDSCNKPSRIETNKGLSIDGKGNYEWAVRYIGPKP